MREYRCLAVSYRMIFLTILVVAIVVVFIFYVQLFNHLDSFKVITENRDFQLLEELLEAEKKPILGKTIFFIDSTRNITSLQDPIDSGISPTMEKNAANLTIRQACAIESAAHHHLDLDIFVLFTTNFHDNKGLAKKVAATLLSYQNVHFRYLNVWKLLSNTAFYDWFSKGKLFGSSYPIEHMSDYLRLIVLWKYGGIYLDTDVIVLRSLAKLPSNFIGAESKQILSNAILGFSSDGIGHAIAEICLNEFQNNYRPDLWSFNGPMLLGRIFKGLCNEKTVLEILQKKHCMGFEFYPPHMFYPISYERYHEIFSNADMSSSLDILKESYTLHLWNKLSKSFKLNEGTLGAYGKKAAENCPKIYALAKGNY